MKPVCTRTALTSDDTLRNNALNAGTSADIVTLILQTTHINKSKLFVNKNQQNSNR